MWPCTYLERVQHLNRNGLLILSRCQRCNVSAVYLRTECSCITTCIMLFILTMHEANGEVTFALPSTSWRVSTSLERPSDESAEECYSS